MVVEKTILINNDKKNMALNDAQYGKLIWPRFFGVKLWRRWLHIGAKLMMFPTGACFFSIFLYGLVTVSSISDRIACLLGLILGLFLMTASIIFYQKEKRATNYVSMFFRGDLDWDLYENGIYGRKSIYDFSDNNETKFFFFKDISKIYLNIDDRICDNIVELMKNADKSYAQNDETKWNESDYHFTKEERNLIKESVWFVDKKTNFPMFFLAKELIKDQAKLEVILRQKVKEVI